MNSQVALLKLTLCGPSDVGREIAIAREVIEDWNRLHAEAKGLLIKPRHWSTDTYLDVRDRTQAVVNAQIVDDAKVLVAVFWSRFGTATGVAGSGTEEEIRRSVAGGRKTFIYFSDLESVAADTDRTQRDRLWKFRQELHDSKTALTGNFKSRDEFRKLFANHLALAMNTFDAPEPPKRARPVRSPRKQTAKGKNIIQQMGDGNTVNQYQLPPKVVNEIKRRPGSITAENEHQISEWIAKLAQGETKMALKSAFGMWRNRFYKKFKVTKAGELDASKMGDVKTWYIQAIAIQTGGLKFKAPDMWRNRRYGSIKGKMREMGIVDDQAYYRDLSERLNIKKPFTSLKDLTKANLDRVYRKVLGDARTQ
jgi:hypothetical protein